MFAKPERRPESMALAEVEPLSRVPTSRFPRPDPSCTHWQKAKLCFTPPTQLLPWKTAQRSGVCARRDNSGVPLPLPPDMSDREKVERSREHDSSYPHKALASHRFGKRRADSFHTLALT